MTLTLNASTQTTASTDAGGNFSFPNIPAGSDYLVTLSKPNFIFSPISQGGTNIQADRPLFFTGDLSSSATVQFSAATQSAIESIGSMTIDVIRSGDTSGISTADYATTATDQPTPSPPPTALPPHL